MDDHTPPPHGGPLPPPAPPTPRPRWTDVPIARDQGRGKVGGVIAGLGRSYGFDLRLVRILFALACLFFPSLILAYLGAWILLPPDASRAASLRNMFRQGNRLSAGAIVGLAFIALTVLITIDSPFHASGVSWGVVLVMVGVLLWVGTDRITGRTSAPSPTAPWPGAGTGPAAAPQGPPTPPWAPAPPAPSSGTTTTFAATAPTTSFGVPRPHEPARRRIPVGSVGFLLTVLGVGTAGLGHVFGWWTLSLLGTAITTVFVLLGLVGLSAIVNRSYAPLPLVPPLALLATALLVVQPNLSGGVGQRTVTPATVAEAGARQRMAAGRLTLDLRDLPAAAAQPVTVRAEVGFGQLRVLVPAGAVLDLRTSVGAGHVVVDGDEIGDGVRIDTTTVNRPAGTATMTVIVDAEVGAGELAIERGTAAR